MPSSCYILDGSGFIFRAYHGLPFLSDDQWRNINAVFGFMKMLLTLLKRHPSHFIIARDSPVRTKRKEQFDDYKAQRIAMPDEFYRQMNSIKNLISKSGLSAYEIEGYEADDIIATVASYGTTDMPVTIVTSDKDMRQLITDHVTIYDAQKDTTRDTTRFTQEYGFLPNQFIEYQALLGDAADNIPGAAGIGPVGAKNLIQQRWTIHNIYQHIRQLSPKLANILLTSKDNVMMSLDLVTLSQIPGLLPRGVEDCIMPSSFKDLEHQLLWVWNFKSLAPLFAQINANYNVGKQESLFW